MSNVRTMRRLALAGGTTALVVMGALTAGCSSSEEGPAPTTTPTSTTSATVSETQKALTPGGNNSFSPTIDPTPPGASCRSVVNGVCIR